MLVVVSGNDNHEISKFLSIEYDIPIQCVSEDFFVLSPDELIRTYPHYFRGLIRDINYKIGGRSQILHHGQLPRVFAGAMRVPNTMVIAADVCQRSVKDNLMLPLAAVVGSYDTCFSKYAVSVSAQSSTTEVITNLDEMVSNLLKFFQLKNSCLPRNILFYRNCISNNQIDEIKNEELPLIAKAFTDIGSNAIPKVTALALQMNHNIRFIGNFERGTYVDHTITGHVYEEFYLACQYSPNVL